MSDPRSVNELLEATTNAVNSLNEATTEIRREREIRRVQVVIEAIAVCLLLALLLVVRGESQDRAADLEAQSLQNSVANCEAINDGRTVLRDVLQMIVEDGRDRRTPEEQAETEELFREIVGNLLQPVSCDPPSANGD